MNQIIQLIHPAGRKAVRMDKEKYDSLRNSILKHLKTKGDSTHSEILLAVTEDFKKNNLNFEGSIEWHLEWVKLDLEARKEIIRTVDKSPIKFTIG